MTTIVNSRATKVRKTKDVLKSTNDQGDENRYIAAKRDRYAKNNPNNQISPWQFYFALSVLISCVTCLVSVYWLSRDFLSASSEIKKSGHWFWDNLSKIHTVGGAKKIGALILQYKDSHYYSVYGAYFATYILLQSLCIPGSLLLSIVAGYLFSPPLALLIICSCSTLGASTFFILIQSKKETVIKFVDRLSRGKIEQYKKYVQAKIREHASNLFLCVFILRATPVFPNWSINLCSPLIDLPFRPFILGTFFGVAPMSIVHVWTGRVLHDLSNDQSLVKWESVIMTSLVVISIVFILYIRRLS